MASSWSGATPSAHVTEDAFERISTPILDDVRRGGFDDIFLDLHGAAVAEHVPDTEGELIKRIRRVVGVDIPFTRVSEPAQWRPGHLLAAYRADARCV